MTDDRRQRLGATGEQLAADHLQRLGLQIVDRNYRTRHGELDIVALDGTARIVFCEVKTRIAYGHARDPLESLHARKQNQVRAIAGRWLVERKDRPHARDLRFDAIGVTLDPSGRLLRLDHLEGAF
jgi:putative endonuclease